MGHGTAQLDDRRHGGRARVTDGHETHVGPPPQGGQVGLGDGARTDQTEAHAATDSSTASPTARTCDSS